MRLARQRPRARSESRSTDFPAEPVKSVARRSTSSCATTTMIGAMLGRGQLGTTGFLRLRRTKNTVVVHAEAIIRAWARHNSVSAARVRQARAVAQTINTTAGPKAPTKLPIVLASHVRALPELVLA